MPVGRQFWHVLWRSSCRVCRQRVPVSFQIRHPGLATASSPTQLSSLCPGCVLLRHGLYDKFSCLFPALHACYDATSVILLIGQSTIERVPSLNAKEITVMQCSYPRAQSFRPVCRCVCFLRIVSCLGLGGFGHGLRGFLAILYKVPVGARLGAGRPSRRLQCWLAPPRSPSLWAAN